MLRLGNDYAAAVNWRVPEALVNAAADELDEEMLSDVLTSDSGDEEMQERIEGSHAIAAGSEERRRGLPLSGRNFPPRAFVCTSLTGRAPSSKDAGQPRGAPAQPRAARLFDEPGRTRPVRGPYLPGQWVLYWIKRSHPNRQAAGRWHGPARVLSTERQRPASLREWNQISPQEAAFRGSFRGSGGLSIDLEEYRQEPNNVPSPNEVTTQEPSGPPVSYDLTLSLSLSIPMSMVPRRQQNRKKACRNLNKN